MAGVNGCELLVTPFQPKTARQTYKIAERATIWNSVLEYWNPSPVAWSSSGSFWTAHSNFCLHQCLETLNAYADGLCHQQLTRSTQIKTDILAQVLQVLCTERLCPRWSLEVYSNPQAFCSLEIVLASASSFTHSDGQPLGQQRQPLCVELLKHIFVFNLFEDHHHLVEWFFELFFKRESGAALGITDKMEAWPQLPLFVPQAWTRDEGVRPCDSDLFFPLLGWVDWK